MSQFRVGIVGCGEATQILHLPSLYQLNEQFAVTALCDVSKSIMREVGRRWGIATQIVDYRELVVREDVDIILVANPNPYHFPVTVAAIDAGKHVLVEKPMCFSTEEADTIGARAREGGVVVQVGYMRRYAPSFVEACRRVKQNGPIRMARVHAVIGANSQFVAPTSRVIRGNDVPEEARIEAAQMDADATLAAIGKVSTEISNAYHLLLGLSSHDLSAMREIIGTPSRVLSATMRRGGRCLTATFDYGDFVCSFDTGIDQIARFDASIEVFGDEEEVRVEYNTPYVRNLPTLVTSIRAKGTHGVEISTQHDWGDSFVEEWRALHENITEGKEPKTSAADFRQDLVTFQEMIRHFQASPT
ncbi:MAG: Gfo/Idh/MocA family protein [bacterium]